MIKAIIFDCFGVLITDGLSQMVNAAPEGVREQIVDLLHASHRGLVPAAESNTSIAELLGMTDDEYRAQISQLEVKNQPLLEYIVSLRSQYKTAMLSNIGRSSIDKRFSKAELDTHFDEIFISGDLGIAKPDREIYELAATTLGVLPEECVFTDDRPEFCEAAARVGMKAIQFTSLSDFTDKLSVLLDI